MSDIKTLVKQSSHYFVGQAAILAAGFLSFPILTRIFSVGEYGLMSLVTTTLFIAVAVVKFGIPNSIVRFYAEYRAADRLPSFFSTLFLALSGFAL
ncbi:MAG: oligosaccharide flippase family protein, partial [Geobacteraceae bacterium]|nr:oligosaccharide flippase family protein [Geobacteraceae bacterium]